MSQPREKRDTPYARLICEGRLELGDGNEFRVEKLYVKGTGENEIRFSWWKNDRLTPRPMEVTEPQLVKLFDNGIKAGVFSTKFIEELLQLL
jgi:hypothetical protein